MKILLMISFFIVSSSFGAVTYDTTANLLGGYIDIYLYASGIGIVVSFIIVSIIGVSIIRLFQKSSFSINMKF